MSSVHNVLGFQGAGGSSYRHLISHRFLLLRQLREGWLVGDAGARFFGLPPRGETQYLSKSETCVI